ncbi:MAG: tetratricopeptide repeat protein, partial [Planctomycetota bacterium]
MKTRILIVLAIASLITFPERIKADTIEMMDGNKKLKVQIVQETLEKVEYKKPGLPNQSVPSDKVREVRFYVSGTDYKTAQEAYTGGDWLTAAKLFKDYADSLDSKKDALKSHCLYLSGDSYQKSAQWKDAISVMNEFTKSYPEHRLYPQAIKKRALCLMNDGDVKKAKAEFLDLKKELTKKKIGD